jgi:hypothetical protein
MASYEKPETALPMSNDVERQAPISEETQVPDWEAPPPVPSKTTFYEKMRNKSARNGAGGTIAPATITDATQTQGSPLANRSIGARFNSVLPAEKSYFGRSRKTFLIVLVVLVLALLALIIGLAAGLSHKKSSSS